MTYCSSLAPYNASHVAMVYERGYAASHVTWTLVPLDLEGALPRGVGADV